jgi:demethylmenaquinone methyltransferase/2-methoxy-6-polyprenyl-1,4-benzoquinol methylase
MDTQLPPPAHSPLHGMFTAVPPRYDLINHVITLGIDTRWRRLAAEACLEEKPRRILDLACGTGDLAITIARLAGQDVKITGLDYSLPMLERARHKAAAARVSHRVEFIEGDATSLPFPDSSIDCIGISFAFRNLTWKNPLCRPHFAEVTRVLRPGGRYVIVESSQPRNRLVRALFHRYLRIVVGPAGIILSGEKGAYRYLTESISDFYSPSQVRELLFEAGFHYVNYRPLFFGAAGIHIALR